MAALPLVDTNLMLRRLANLKVQAVASMATVTPLHTAHEIAAVRWLIQVLQARSARLALGLTIGRMRKNEAKAALVEHHVSTYTLMLDGANRTGDLGLGVTRTLAGVFVTTLRPEGDVAAQYTDGRCAIGDTLLRINGVTLTDATVAGIARALGPTGAGRPLELEFDRRLRARQTRGLEELAEWEAYELLLNLGCRIWAQHFDGEGIDGLQLSKMTSVEALEGFVFTTEKQRVWLVGAIHEARMLGVPSAWLVAGAWDAHNVGHGALYDVWLDPAAGERLGISITGVAGAATDMVVLGQITPDGACAKACPFASVGDIVMAINGVSCIGLNLDEVQTMVIEAGRPLMLSCFTPVESEDWVKELGGAAFVAPMAPVGQTVGKKTAAEHAAEHKAGEEEMDRNRAQLRIDVEHLYEATVLSEKDTGGEFDEDCCRRLLAALRRLPHDERIAYMATSSLNVLIDDDAELLRVCASDIRAMSMMIHTMRLHPENRMLSTEALHFVDRISASAPIVEVVSPRKMAIIDVATAAMVTHEADKVVLMYGHRLLERSTSLMDSHECLIETTTHNPSPIVTALGEATHSARLCVAALDKLRSWVETPVSSDDLVERQLATLRLAAEIEEYASRAVAVHPHHRELAEAKKKIVAAMIARAHLVPIVGESKASGWM